ncbi:MAG: phenylalanine--tRNA ligase subunit beta [Gammaproteobacteria bacterium]
MSHDEQVPVRVADSSACPVYRGCLIKGVNARRETPLWMRERLRRSGLRPVQALVDITNYVLLELGQPLHAFDANKLSGEVHVRFARPGETMVLLDQKDITLAADNLIIADDSGPIALAGIMGGLHTAIDEDTTDVFLECAHFSPASMIGRARQHGLHTDASHRFERGVDPGLPARALQRTVELIQAIVGGQAGPETTVLDERNTAARASIMLTAASLKSVLDVTIPAELVEKKLRALGCRVDPLEAQWRVTPPSHRFDLAIEEDLIEEVARLYGYDKLPAVLPIAPVSPVLSSERTLSTTRLQQIMAASGFQEVITYSFVSEELQSLVDPERVPLRLRNPISSEMSVMRTSMWPGLLRAAAYNQNRRHTSIRLFEIGQVFRGQLEEGALHQDVWVGGLWTGEAQPEQWDLPRRAVDFYDLKGKIESILLACGHTVDGQMSFRFVPEVHPALHPGQSARVCALNGTSVGWAGRLHPVVEKKLGFDGAVFVFELPLEWIESINLPQFKAVSRLPSVRRDIAVVVSEAVSVGSVQAIIRAECGALIKDVRVFDVFRGASVPEGKKSLALGVTLQSAERTLTESDVSGCFEQVIQRLRKDLGAQLRE